MTRPTSSVTWPRRSPSTSRTSWQTRTARTTTTTPAMRRVVLTAMPRRKRARRPESGGIRYGPPQPPSVMKLLDAELTHSREFLPGQWLQGYRAPWLAAGAHAGQFVHVRTPDYSGLVLRRPFSLNTVDRTTGDISIHFRVTGKGTEVLARMRTGDSIGMLGP